MCMEIERIIYPGDRVLIPVSCAGPEVVHAEHVLPPPDATRPLSGTVPELSPLVAEQAELDDRDDLEQWDGGAGCKKKSKSKKRKRSSAKS